MKVEVGNLDIGGMVGGVFCSHSVKKANLTFTLESHQVYSSPSSWFFVGKWRNLHDLAWNRESVPVKKDVFISWVPTTWSCLLGWWWQLKHV